MRDFCRRIVEAPGFDRTIIVLIVFNAALVGLETSPDLMGRHGDALHFANHIVLAVFILEAALKIGAVAPNIDRYFRNGWNLFDFAIIIASLIPASGEFAMVARLVRLLRVLRLISTVPRLRLIVATLVRAIPSMGHVLSLMSIVFYVYGIAGFHLFQRTDPEHWGDLGASLLTLFQVVTLEGWADIMRKAMEHNPFAWIYFVSFVVVGTFVVINLFIAVVINSLEESKQLQLEELREPVTRDEILRELQTTREALIRLHERLDAHTGDPHEIPAASPMRPGSLVKHPA